MTAWTRHPVYQELEVSDDGQVRTIDRVISCSDGRVQRWSGKTLSQHTDSCGYQAVNGRRRVHVLVCETFHGMRPAPGMEVRHLDGNKRNNSAGNLAWGTRSENVRDLVRHGGHHLAKKTHCVNGHQFTEKTTGINKRGNRFCRVCNRHQARLRLLARSVERR